MGMYRGHEYWTPGVILPAHWPETTKGPLESKRVSIISPSAAQKSRCEPRRRSRNGGTPAAEVPPGVANRLEALGYQ